MVCYDGSCVFEISLIDLDLVEMHVNDTKHQLSLSPPSFSARSLLLVLFSLSLNTAANIRTYSGLMAALR